MKVIARFSIPKPNHLISKSIVNKKCGINDKSLIPH